MPEVETKTNCFLEHSNALVGVRLSELRQRSSFDLGEMSRHDFDYLPDCPNDCIEGQSLVRFIDVGREEFEDADGSHTFDLSQLKGSLVAVLGGVSDDQVESYGRRWARHFLVHNGWENLPAEATQKDADEAFEKLYPFLQRFCPLCREAIASGKNIYFLWELHVPVEILKEEERGTEINAWKEVFRVSRNGWVIRKNAAAAKAQDSTDN